MISLKQFIKNILPTALLDYLAKLKYTPNNSPYKEKNTKDVFDTIYKKNTWGSEQSISGQGSTLDSSENIIKGLNELLSIYGITSILDVPCGDFNWMKEVDLSNVSYIGGDIVPDLIQKNNTVFGSETISFKEINLISDKLANSDLILVRDCFVHFSYNDISNALKNIKSSGSKYLLATTFTKKRFNYDIITGDWRPLNLNRKPFNFPKPMLTIEENFNPSYKKDYRGKSLSFWAIDDIIL